uniref:RNA helicase n=1 Tax=Panagrellus redivivus TaxID=6233 RepID=A0A7E4W3Q5_PANRE
MSDSSDDEYETPQDVEEEVEEEEVKSFAELGVNEVLCETCERLGWKKPSKIQAATLPAALSGKDIIGLAETGSGKTGAFAIPMLQELMEAPQKIFGLVLTPTRELAYQIADQFRALGSSMGLIVAVIVGGVDKVQQSLALSRRPHIIVATPGRLVDHLEETKGFNLRSLKYLVMDEADRMLNLDFEVELDKILKVIPRDRRTFLFSATMTKKVSKLERASLKDPERIEVSSKYKTVDSLAQYLLFVPQKYKEAHLVHLLNEKAGNSFIVFCATCQGVMKTTLMLRHLGFPALPLHGQMTQAKRLGSLNKFRSKERSILVCTDVASRGLDIPHVDVVINYDVPIASKDYIHRVGRTARAGRQGVAVTVVTQYDVELYHKVETLIGKKLDKYPVNNAEVQLLSESVTNALRLASGEVKELQKTKFANGKKKLGDSAYLDDGDADEGSSKYLKKGKGKRKAKGGGPGGDKMKMKRLR